MTQFIFGLIGGTALLMYGVEKMGDGLEKASGKFMRKILSVLTGNVWSAFFVGIVMTVLVQSSTAITVLTVGFVNAGLMKLSQAIGIIYGANIGTTITAQLMAFSFKFKLTEIALPVIGVGFAVSYFAKKETLKNLGNAFLGFGMMFLGLKILNSGIPFIKSSEEIKWFFENYASITVIGIILGAVATALVHSSSATVALVMMLGQAGVIGLPGAIAIMLGDNIGTCITAQLASMTGNINARRTAWAHTLYNVIGVLICVILFYPFINLVEYVTMRLGAGTDIGMQIANSHTIFNVLSAVLFLPLNKYYVRFLEKVIRDKSVDRVETLDKNLINTPVAAFKATLQETVNALGIVKDMINKSLSAFYNDEKETMKEVAKKEEQLNAIQKRIVSYIVEISKQPLTEEYSPMIPAFINAINNVERAGDHTTEYMQTVTTKILKGLKLTDESFEEIKDIQEKINQMLDITVDSINNKDSSTIERMHALENAVDLGYQNAIDNHIKRLEQGQCSIESGIIFVELVTHMERIADHIYKVFLISISDDLIHHL